MINKTAIKKEKLYKLNGKGKGSVAGAKNYERRK